MRRARLSDPLRQPLFRRLATTYAVNELGDWMGIVALSVLVFDQHRQRLGDHRRSSSAPASSPPSSPRSSSPGSSGRRHAVALPVIYCGEAAAFGGPGTAGRSISRCAGVIVLATIDGALALAGRSLTRAVVVALLEPAGELRAGNAVLNVAFTGGRGDRARAGRPRRRRLRRPVGTAARRRLLLCDRLDAAHRRAATPRRSRNRAAMRERVRAGLAYIREQATLRRLLVAQGAAFVFFAAVIPIEVIYAKQTLGAGDCRLRTDARKLGSRNGRRQHRLRRGRAAPPLPSLLFFSTIAVGAGYLGLAARPNPGGRLRGVGRRGGRQRRAVGGRRSAPCRS